MRPHPWNIHSQHYLLKQFGRCIHWLVDLLCVCYVLPFDKEGDTNSFSFIYSICVLSVIQFGKGIYFADMSSKSANYCFASRTKNIGLVLLCDVCIIYVLLCDVCMYVSYICLWIYVVYVSYILSYQWYHVYFLNDSMSEFTRSLFVLTLSWKWIGRGVETMNW